MLQVEKTFIFINKLLITLFSVSLFCNSLMASRYVDNLNCTIVIHYFNVVIQFVYQKCKMYNT